MNSKNKLSNMAGGNHQEERDECCYDPGVTLKSKDATDESCSYTREGPEYLCIYTEIVCAQRTNSGYIITHKNGRLSIVPKVVFEKEYRPITDMTFGLAIEAMNKGNRVMRRAWKGKGMFVFNKPSNWSDVEHEREEPKTLTQKVMDLFSRKCGMKSNAETGENYGVVKFSKCICMRSEDGPFVNGWVPSQEDMFADDWMIF